MKLKQLPALLYSMSSYQITVSYGKNEMVIPPKARELRVEDASLLSNMSDKIQVRYIEQAVKGSKK